MEINFTAAYADIVAGKFAFMGADGVIKVTPLIPKFVESFCSVKHVVTIGEWAANFGLLNVKSLLPKQTFGTIGFVDATLEDKVKFIYELVNSI